MLTSLFLKTCIHLTRSKMSKYFQIFLSNLLNDHQFDGSTDWNCQYLWNKQLLPFVKLLWEGILMDIIIPLHLRKERRESYVQSVFRETKHIILETGIWAIKRQNILLYVSFKFFINLQKYVGIILQKM